MGKYQALVDLSLGANFYVNAGEQFSDTDSRVPIGWEPPCHAVSPLDADAVNKVWLMGPQLPRASRGKLSSHGGNQCRDGLAVKLPLLQVRGGTEPLQKACGH
jgi:hypothetical protein